jgi:hypothetical protein
MKKTSEYHAQARECRELAAKMVVERDRQMLMKMATLWEQLAEDRLELVRRYPDLASA